MPAPSSSNDENRDRPTTAPDVKGLVQCVAYVDASALTKLILDEPGSVAMYRWYLEADRVTSSVIGLSETRRAVERRADDLERADTVPRSSPMPHGPWVCLS